MMLRLMALLTLLGATMAWAAAPNLPWSKEQKDKLAQSARLERSLPRLLAEADKDALATMRRIAALETEVRGATAPQAVAALHRLANHHQRLEQFQEAIELRREVLRLRESRLGKAHWETIDARIALEDVVRLQGLTQEQRQGLLQATVWNLQSTLAVSQLGQLQNGIVLAGKARDVRKKTLGEQHPNYADCLTNLGALHAVAGQPADALRAHSQALAAYKAALGEQHPSCAMGLRNLANRHHDAAEYAKALPLYVQSRQVYAATLGENHRFHVGVQNDLAQLYRDTGEFAKALPLAIEVVEHSRQAPTNANRDHAIKLSNLAALYIYAGDHAKALPLLLESRDSIRGKSFYSPNVQDTNIFNNLGQLYRKTGDHAKALPLLIQARNNCKKFQGVRHSDYASITNNLASLYRVAGDHASALPLCLEARDLRRETLGERHPEYAGSLSALADLYSVVGKPKEAAEASGESLTVLRRHLDDGFDLYSERQRAQAMQRVSHHLGFHLSNQERAGHAADERYAPVLAWKGLLAERTALDRVAADRPELKEAVGKLQSARLRLARVTLQTPPPAQQAAWLKQVQSLTEEREAQEAELSRLSVSFRASKRLRNLTSEQVAERLPQGVAFVDLLDYDHQLLPNGGKGEVAFEERLLAFVSRKGEGVVAVPLGATKPVADAVARWRAEIEVGPTKADRKSSDAASATIRRLVWDRLAKHLDGATTVVVAPDGPLCQFPFAALPGAKAGTHLIEEIGLAQVTSGAQLFSLMEPVGKDAKVGKGLVVAGGIDYGEGNLYSQLLATGPEARRCRELFTRAFADDRAALLEGKDASPLALREAVTKRPKYLHLATHGYFEPAEKVLRELKGLASRRPDHFATLRQYETLSNLPGLRCGLALSGANAVPPTDDPEALPNVLTGDELAHVDLRGCDVAVLSACQTALGDVQRTQGVVGLQRSLHTAGVRTTVTSLWCVQDAATAELMDEFYKNLWGEQKMTRLEALRQAQLTILRDPDRVRARSQRLLADAKERGLSEDAMRGIKGRLATDLPDGGKVEDKPKRSPEAWWAAFVLCGDWR